MELLQSLLSSIWGIFLVIFFFGGSIFVHELGHFLAARRRGVIVERFSIGMGPPMFKWKGRDGVEYWISWLPLGGYVKLPQLADLGAIEGPNTADYSSAPPPSYSTKVIVFLAGAVFNLVFAFLLASVLWMIGMPTQEDLGAAQVGEVSATVRTADGNDVPSPASRAGLRPGDVILAVDGKPVEDWSAMQAELLLGAGRAADGVTREVRLQVQRDDGVQEVVVNPVLAGAEKRRMIGIAPAYPVIVESVQPGSFSERIGLKPNDTIRAVDTTRIYRFNHLLSYLESRSAARTRLEVLRDGQTVTLDVPPQPSARNYLEGTTIGWKVSLMHEPPLRQMERIFQMTFRSLVSLVHPRTDVGLDDVQGPIGIVSRFWEAATSSYPLRVVMWFTVVINISLAVFNLLPIPVLDGGHILFATIAKLRGRALPAEFVNATQSVFVILLFSMIIYVSFQDVRREIRSDNPVPAKASPSPTPTPASP